MSNNNAMVDQALSAITTDSIDKDLQLNQLKAASNSVVDNPIVASQTKEDNSKIDLMVDKLMGFDFNDSQVKDDVAQGLHVLNEKVMDSASEFTSKALNKQMSGLKGVDEDDVVYNSMKNLNSKIKEIHPSKFDLTEKWFHGLPLIGKFLSPIRDYFFQFQTMGSVIEGYKDNINRGIEERELDLDILREDKQSLYKAEKILRSGIEFNKLLQEKLEEKIKMNVSDKAQKQFLEGQILHNLLRHTQGLEEMRAVNIQGQMSMEMLLKTGIDVIDGAKRCIRISINALTIAGVIQQVLTGQKKLLEVVQETNKVATESVAWNDKMLTGQVMEVSKMAMNTSLDMEVLISAIENSTKAIDDDIKYRQESLPIIQERINRLSTASNQAEKTTKLLSEERSVSERSNTDASLVFEG
jgi:uncharacterized protein YaaN involved in tellurite resistance